jgi:hypothetical protein
LNFFQSLVSQELAIGGQFHPKSGEGAPDEAPYQNAHRKQIIVRIMASLQRVLRAKDIDLLSPRLREMYHVLLIAIVNNQDVSTFTPPGQEEGQYSCSFAWVVAKTDSVGSLLSVVLCVLLYSVFCCTLCFLCSLLFVVVASAVARLLYNRNDAPTVARIVGRHVVAHLGHFGRSIGASTHGWKQWGKWK